MKKSEICFQNRNVGRFYKNKSSISNISIAKWVSSKYLVAMGAIPIHEVTLASQMRK